MEKRYEIFLFILFLTLNACSASQMLSQQKMTQTHKHPIIKLEKNIKNIYQVIEVSQGDLACYVDLLDLSTQKQTTFPASFDWCETGRLQQGQTYIIDFEEIEITDCVSIEPCDATRKVISLKQASVYKSN